MEIKSTQPHLVFEIDSAGNMTSEALNYPNNQGVCQGEIATNPFEDALANAGLIPQVNKNDREYKNNLSVQTESINHSQQINQPQQN